MALAAGDLGRSLEFLSMGGARAVLFDIMFTERSSALESANDLSLAQAPSITKHLPQHGINRWTRMTTGRPIPNSVSRCRRILQQICGEERHRLLS